MLRKRGLWETIKRPLIDCRLKEIVTTILPKLLELWLANKLVCHTKFFKEKSNVKGDT